MAIYRNLIKLIYLINFIVTPHNLKVVGSNPAAATTETTQYRQKPVLRSYFFVCCFEFDPKSFEIVC